MSSLLRKIRDWSSAKPLSSEEIEARAARDEERREKKAQKKHAKEASKAIKEAMKADKHPSGIPAPPQQPKPLYNLTPLSQVLLQSKRDLALLRTNRNQIAIAPISASASQLAVPGIINSGTPALPTTPRSPRPGSLAASAPQLPNVIQQQRSTPLQSLSPTQAQFQSSAQPQSHSPPQASSSIPLPNQGQGLGLIANAVNTSQNAGPSAAAGQAQQTVDFDAMEAKLDLFISFYDEWVQRLDGEVHIVTRQARESELVNRGRGIGAAGTVPRMRVPDCGI